MFPTSENSCPFPNSSNQRYNNQIGQKSLQIKLNHSRQSRQNKLSRLRQISSTNSLKYQQIPFSKFKEVVQNQKNPYSLLLTIFVIADDYNWRQYLPHLQILIKYYTNFVYSSKGKVLSQIRDEKQLLEKLGGYHFQQRLQTMLHLSNKQFQMHLLILIHALIAYNKTYCILNQNLLSDHLTYKHSYEKYYRQQVVWLLTRLSVSCQALNKIMKNYINNQENCFVLPVLTIIANFIYEQPSYIIQQFITTNDFQNILAKGLCSQHFQIQRQAVFICNNIAFKNQNCHNFIISQEKLVNQIQKLNNQQAKVFLSVINANRKEKVLSQMEEEHTFS